MRNVNAILELSQNGVGTTFTEGTTATVEAGTPQT